MTRPRRASRRGPRLLGSEFISYYSNNHYFFFCFVFALPYINKPTGTWRSGGADGSVVYVLRRICRNIVEEEQRGMAKVACLRKCRYGPRVKLSPSLKESPKLDTQRRSIWFQGVKGKSKDLAVRPNGRRVLKLIKDLGESVRFGLTSRVDTAPHEIESQKY